MMRMRQQLCDNVAHRATTDFAHLNVVPPLPLIAVVDDDESLRKALVGLMRSLGYGGRGFANAEELLSAQDHYHCIVSDLYMPGLTGLELLLKLRADGDETPFIIITAHFFPGLHDTARACGARCVLGKPFDAQDLVRRVEGSLENRTH